MNDATPVLRRPEVGFPPTVPELLRRAVQSHPDDPFVLTADETWTFAQVDARARSLAGHLLRSGVGKGSRVGLLLPQGPEWVVGFLAVARIGAVAALLSTFSTPWEAGRALELGDIAHLLTSGAALDRDLQPYLEEAVPGLAAAGPGTLRLASHPYLRTITVLGGSPSPPWATQAAAGADDLQLVEAVEAHVVPADWLVVIFTSGTTAGPKAVVHTHGAQVRQAVQFTQLRDQTHEDRFFAALPFFWVGGLTMSLLPALHLASGLVCQRRFEPGSALDLVEHTRPTVYMGWPNIPQRMRDHPSFTARQLTGIPFLTDPPVPPTDPTLLHNSLGMTETAAMHAMAPHGEVTRLLPEELRGSFGAPVPGVEHRIVDVESGLPVPDGREGEICVRGYSLMAGLYKREREDVFTPDGWYRTGDRGLLRDGLLFFTGRISDLIKTAGSNVSAAEVELALGSLQDVRGAVVVGLPDEERGQVVAALVAVVAGSTLTSAELQQEARQLLSVYKVPRHVVVVPEEQLPWLPSGKVDRQAARAALEARLDGQPTMTSAP